MTALRDLTGQRFGRLSALHVAAGEDARHYVRWLCVCDCGEQRCVARGSLLNGDTRSCGCLQAEAAKARRITHGLSKTPEYVVWKNMHSRCEDSRNKAYHNYGGRGISVCPDWSTFEAFFADMGKRPAGMTLERKENEKDYCKTNCVWATRAAQQSNTRRTRHVTAFGRTQALSQWSAETDLSISTIANRLKQGVPAENSLIARPKIGRRLSTLT